jgi:hypothetical protein
LNKHRGSYVETLESSYNLPNSDEASLMVCLDSEEHFMDFIWADKYS